MATLAAGGPSMPGHAAIGDDRSVLDSIRHSLVNLAVWRRRLATPLAEAARAIASAGIGDIRFTAAPDAVAETIAHRLGMAGAGPADRELIAADIARLADVHAAIMRLPLIEARLERITTNACHKFHADYVSARLITTYHGPGTEWIDTRDAARHAAGAPVATLAVRRLPTGAVALFKGRIWAPEDAIVHRSPPIAGSGEARLVLVINPGTPERCLPD